MSWELRLGEQIKFYIEHAKRGHEPSIRALENAPQIPGGLAGDAYQCLGDLGGERSFGFGAGPIPWRAVRAWADEHGFATPDDFDGLLSVVQHIDGLWLAAAGEKAKSETKGKKGGGDG